MTTDSPPLAPLTRNVRPDREPTDIHRYEAGGGYLALRESIGRRAPAE